MNVIKRDGRKIPFNRDRVVRAVTRAWLSLYDEADVDKVLIDKIADSIESRQEQEMRVEEIQDIVENKLMASSHKDVARAYIRYRFMHGLARDQYKELMDVVGEKLSASNVQNQNANVDEHSFGGRLGEAQSAVARKYALDYIVSPMARRNHERNEIYIHDLDSYAVGNHNCLSIPFDKLLAEGFTTKQVDIRPANSLSTAFQLVAVIFQVQSLQQFGGVSATHLDWTMMPYVRKSFYKHYMEGSVYIPTKKVDLDSVDNTTPIDDVRYRRNGDLYQYAMDMTIKECNQATEGLLHNLNSLQSRSGNQLPFTSINYGTCTLPEGRMVIKSLLEASIKGVGKFHRTSIFPCSIFQCMTGVNRHEGDPNYDLFRLALRSTAQRLYPNYCNCNWSGNAGFDRDDPKTYFSTMGCRTANGWDINGMGQTKDGRGNICPVTIIMPTLAMEADGDVEKFMTILDTKLTEAKDMLLERFDWICSQSADGARFMYENGTMAGYVPSEGIRSALKHGTLAVGQLGLAETLQILIGKDHTTEAGMELAKRIEQLFKDRCAEFKEQYKLNFGVYYSPAENLCYKAMLAFRDKYGIIPEVSDHDFFTNSMHVPVWYECTPFEKIDIESQLTGYSSAGCITYVEVDSGVKNNIDALETIVNYAMDKDVPYFAINVPSDTCLDCGYQDEVNDVCPECGGKNIERLRRVTGYLSTDYRNFNKGKQQEVELRVKHQRFNE